MIPTVYRGSVKDLLAPARIGSTQAALFEYTDSYSVFDWGRMPDSLPRKGEALAVLAAEIFERLEKPEAWKEYSKTLEALALRKGNRFGSVFNEVGEALQSEGLKTHYMGVVDTPLKSHEIEAKRLNTVAAPLRRLAVREVSVVKPALTSVLGRTLPDYYPTRMSKPPRLVPLEVVFRFGVPEGSSLLGRVARDPSYMATLGFSDVKVEAGAKWNFPILEFFTKLEATDRPVSLPEALAISGLSAKQLQDVLLKTAWVSGILKYWFGKIGLELEDGKLEWGISESGECFLVDAIGPDELRLSKQGVQLSKEFLRSFYRQTNWFQAIEKGKTIAKEQGVMDWKKYIQESPPTLPPSYRETAVQVYLALTNEFTGRRWFGDAWPLDRVVQEIIALEKGSVS